MRIIIKDVFLLDFHENVREDHPPLNIWCVLWYSLRKFHCNICRNAIFRTSRLEYLVR